MKNLKPTQLLLMILGIVAITFGIYAGISDKSFIDYFSKLIIGFSLFGIGYINFLITKKEETTHRF